MSVEEIKALKELLDMGAVTQEEYDDARQKILDGNPALKAVPPTSGKDAEKSSRPAKHAAPSTSDESRAASSMSARRKISLAITSMGIVLFLAGLLIPVPGAHLTTYSSLDGEVSSSGERYSSIEEYVGGDAYNFEIGASLVAGEIAGTKAQKAIYESAGLIIASMGAISYVRAKEEEAGTGVI